MGRLAGWLAWSGAIALAIWAFFRAGMGRAGWEAARAALMERFPEARANSIQAIIDAARESVDIGRRQDRGGPNYVPPVEHIPDMRRPFREGNVPVAGIPGDRPPGQFYHEIIIEIFDPRWPDDPIQQYGHTIIDGDLLTNADLEALASERAQQLIDLILSSDPTRFDPEELYWSIRHGGVWIGY